MGSTTILKEIHHCVLKQHSPKIFEKKISIIIKIKQIKSETKTNKGKEKFSLNQRLMATDLCFNSVHRNHNQYPFPYAKLQTVVSTL